MTRLSLVMTRLSVVIYYSLRENNIYYIHVAAVIKRLLYQSRHMNIKVLALLTILNSIRVQQVHYV